MFIEVEGSQFFVVSFGQGARTLVGIGGWTGSWEVWADVFGLLSQGWRTVGIDHRGTGATLAATTGVTFEEMAADLLAVLDQLGIEQCVLAAESSGAATALTAVAQQPHRFAGLVLSGGLYFQPKTEETPPFLQALQADYETAVTSFVTNCLPETDSPAMHDWGRKILLRASQAAAIDLFEATIGLDLRPLLPKITVPTLLLHGDADRILPLASSQWLAEQLPQSHLHVLPGAGHAPMMTFPQEIAAAVNQFFVPNF
jgi:pimeloyl-[acyl-carrier protein] methyl ester esterase